MTSGYIVASHLAIIATEVAASTLAPRRPPGAEIGGHADLVRLVDDRLGVVAVDPALGLGQHDARLGVGEVALRLGVGHRVRVTGPLEGLRLEGCLRFPDLAELAFQSAQLGGQLVAPGVAVEGVLGGVDGLRLARMAATCASSAVSRSAIRA